VWKPDKSIPAALMLHKLSGFIASKVPHYCPFQSIVTDPGPSQAVLVPVLL
jgi:hypothetical protein